MNNLGAQVLLIGFEPKVGEESVSWLTSAGHSPIAADNPDEARTLLKNREFDVVLSDCGIPELPIMELTTLLQGLESVPVLVSVVDPADRETAISLMNLGVYTYIMKPLLRDDVLAHIARAFEYRRLSMLKVGKKVLEHSLQVIAREEEIVYRLVGALCRRTNEAVTHVRRVGLNAALLAKHLGWTAEQVADIRLAAAMHDAGEIGIPDSILLKPGKLSSEEFALVKKHTEIGADILDDSNIPVIRMARDIALCHHEKWDGTGYPNGLAGEDIPEAARIVAVVDVYDALTSERVYRPPLTTDEALAIMLVNRESYFEPRIVDRFLSLLPEIDLDKTTDSSEDVDIELT